MKPSYANKTKPALRSAADQRIKREELKTYRELDLRRDLNSIRNRKRLEAGGVRHVLGDGSSGQPYLPVRKKRYRQVRLKIQRRHLLKTVRAGIILSVAPHQCQPKPRA